MLSLFLFLAWPAQALADAPVDAKIERVLRAPTVASQVGPMETPLPLELANFLLDHPDLSAHIVRKQGIAPYVITVRGPTQSWVDDGDGTSGLINLARREEEHRVYYGEGTHRSAVFPDILADAVIVMDLTPVRRPGCGEHIRSTFQVGVKLRNPVLSGMVKALRVFVKKTIIRKFSKAFLVADRVGRLLAKDPKLVSADVAAYPLSESDRRTALALIAALKPEPAACLP